MGGVAGAGEGNRTLVVSLEGFCSTIELHPPRGSNALPEKTLSNQSKSGGGGWIRTNVGARPTDLQSAPFNHSGTPPGKLSIMHESGFSGKQNRWFPTRSGGSQPRRSGVPAPRIE